MLLRSPFYRKRSGGTCGLTAVGMFGKDSGWGIPYATLFSLFLTVGSISEKPGVVDGHIAIREYLSLTISFDHDIIDGAPAARFTERLKELIESGFGLLTQEVRQSRPARNRLCGQFTEATGEGCDRPWERRSHPS